MCAVLQKKKREKKAHHVQNQHMVSLKTRCPTAICLHAGYTHTHTPSQTRHPSGDLISYSHTNTLCKCAWSCLWFQDSFALSFKQTHMLAVFQVCFIFLARAPGLREGSAVTFCHSEWPHLWPHMWPFLLWGSWPTEKKDSTAKTHSAIWHSTITTRFNLDVCVCICVR